MTSGSPDLRPGRALLWTVFRDDLPRSAKLRLGATVLLSLLAAVAITLSPVWFGITVDRIAGNQGDVGETGIGTALTLSVFFWLAAKLLTEQRWLVYQPAENRMLNDVRAAYLRHILSLPASFHSDRAIGRLEATVGQGLGGLQSLSSALFTQVTPLIFEIAVVLLAVATAVSPAIAGVVAGTLVLYLAALVLGAEKVSRRFRFAIDGSIEAQGRAGDAILNADELRYLGAEPVTTARYRDTLAGVHALFCRFYLARGLFGIVLAGILGAGFAAALAFALAAVVSGQHSIGDLVLLNAVLLQLYRTVEGFGFSYRDSRQALTALRRFVELLSQTPEGAEIAPGDCASRPLPRPLGRVEIRDAELVYPDGRRGLTPLSMVLMRHHITALVGPSGSGKSTLVRLLLRSYAPSGGTVLLDGKDIATIDIASLRAGMAVVPQDAVIFRDSLSFNIALSNEPDADRLAKVAAAANLEALLARLSTGFETDLGERGTRLSGGERQRIALARALYRNPEILILDEATSALDAVTRDAILDTLDVVGRRFVTLVITHDDAVAARADDVVRLETVAQRSSATAQQLGA